MSRDRAGDLPRRHVVVQGAGVHLEGAPPQDQRQLQPEELVEDQPAPGRRHHVERLGHGGWRGTPRSGPTDRATTATRSRQRVGELAGPLAAPPPRTSPISQTVSPTLAEAGYTGRMRSVRRPGRDAGHDVDHRVDHLAAAPVLGDLAEEDRLGAGLELLGPPGLVEEDDVEPAGVVAHRQRRRPRARSGPAATGADCTDASTAASSPTSQVRRRRPGGCGRCSAGGRSSSRSRTDSTPSSASAGRLALRHRLEHRHRPGAQVAEGAAATQSPTGTGRGAGRPGAPRARRRDTPRRATPRSAACPPRVPPRPR